MKMNDDYSITVEIAVTEAMLREGIPKDCSACPVVLGIYSAIATAKDVRATEYRLRFRMGDLQYVADTPADLAVTILCFDRTGTARPVSATVTFRRVA
jgi:hypothetical protein